MDTALIAFISFWALIPALMIVDVVFSRRRRAHRIWPVSDGEYLAPPRGTPVLLDSAQIAKRLREVRQ